MRVLFVGEGRHDIGSPEGYTVEPYTARGIVPVLARRVIPGIGADSVALRWTELARFNRDASKRGRAAKVKAALLIARRKVGAVGVILCVDSDGSDENAIRLEMDAASKGDLPVVNAVAVHAIEVWTLGVPDAIAAELEVSTNDVQRLIPKKPLEELRETSEREEYKPKKILARIAELTNTVSDVGLRERVAERTDVEALAKACPRGFKPFIEALRRAFGDGECG